MKLASSATGADHMARARAQRVHSKKTKKIPTIVPQRKKKLQQQQQVQEQERLLDVDDDDVPRFSRFSLRLCRQQPMTNTLSTTTVMPAATPTSSIPDVPPNGVWLVVGGPPPSDEAGCDGGGASVYDAKVYAIPINCSIPEMEDEIDRRGV